MNTKLMKKMINGAVACLLFCALSLFSTNLGAQTISPAPSNTPGGDLVETVATVNILKNEIDQQSINLANTTQGTTAHTNASYRFKFYSVAFEMARETVKPTIDMNNVFEKATWKLNIQNTSLATTLVNEGLDLVD